MFRELHLKELITMLQPRIKIIGARLLLPPAMERLVFKTPISRQTSGWRERVAVSPKIFSPDNDGIDDYGQIGLNIGIRDLLPILLFMIYQEERSSLFIKE